nr:beta-lactamase family protein [Kineococcus vitellinus]
MHVHALAPGYEQVADLAEHLLSRDPHWTFQLVVHAEQDTVVDLHAGAGYGGAVHVQASATKGIAGLTLALALQENGVGVHEPVARLWPQFAAAGKRDVTIAELFSHQAGLLRTVQRFSPRQWGEGRAVAADLAAQQPLWAPGRAHGYHALSIGPLADEVVHRLTGTALREYYEQRLRSPAAVDFWIRLPDAEQHRLHRVTVPTAPPGPGPCAPDPAPGRPGTLLRAATEQLDAMGPANSWINAPALRAAGIPSVSGCGSARGLADAYATATGVGGHRPLLRSGTLDAVTRSQVSGRDLVLGGSTHFAVLFEKPSPRLDFGTAAAFGHDGAGGALAFADPGTRLAFGYTTAAVPAPAGADPRALAFARLLRRLRTGERSRWPPPQR